MRFAYLSFLGKTPSLNTVEPLCILGLSSVPALSTGVKGLRAGQAMLGIFSINEEPLAFYAISSTGTPQQIWGMRDYLLDNIFLKDLTALYLPAIRSTQMLIAAGYEALTIPEMIQHKKALQEWENACIEENAHQRHDWKACRKACLSLLSEALISETLKEKMSGAMGDVSAPKKEALLQPVTINFFGYPEDKLD